MTNRTVTVSFCSIVVAVCWVVGVTLAVINTIVGPDLGALATAFLIGGAVLTVCRALERHDRNWSAAYEVGKEVGVRRLHDRV